MSRVPVGHYSSFIIRLWVESEVGWRRGDIQHVATHDKRRFSTVIEMLEFIADHCNSGELFLPFTLEPIDSEDGSGEPPEKYGKEGQPG
jgi:hypothetical protein